jgi:ADP-heptose:LPS heptosyltransferase
VERLYSWKQPKPTKTAAVIRYGAFGDVLQSASILPGLKRQGFHVTFFCTPRGVEAIEHDPHIDSFVIQEEDAVPNDQLSDYFTYLGKKFTKVINLCETVEGIVLPMSGRAHFHWPHAARHNICNRNYVEMQHQIAEVPYTKPETAFYPTAEERAWVNREFERIGGRIIVWALTGSAFHKIWPHVDPVIEGLLHTHPYCSVIFVGGPKEESLQGDWTDKRVIKTVGKWSIRQSMTAAKYADVVVGPETGILNAVAMEDNAKVLILSHSSIENLSRDWVNTVSLSADVPCYPCHRLQLDGWQYCNRHEKGTALCQQTLEPQLVYDAIADALDNKERMAA